MRVSLVAALAENRVIGRANQVPWNLPEDLRRFKARTLGHWVIMGRRTFESIGLPLRERTTIVLSAHEDYRPDGVLVARSLDEALVLARDQDEVFILGGEAVYREALPRADRLYLTIVHARIEGDTFFPAFDELDWTLLEEERHEADDRHAHAFTFRTYARRRKTEEAPQGRFSRKDLGADAGRHPKTSPGVVFPRTVFSDPVRSSARDRACPA